MTRTRGLDPMMVLPDLHSPFHHTRALGLVEQVARAFRPKILVAIGDICDFYAISEYDKDPDRSLSLAEELAGANDLMDRLDRWGATEKYALAGNHEFRMRKYVAKHPELAGLLMVERALRLKERGWRYVPYRDHIKIGKCYFTHDVGASGRNAAFRVLDTYQHSSVSGHTHRMQYIVEGNAAGECKLSALFGHLGDVSKMDYMHRAKALKDWALGFGIGYLERATGYVYLTPVPIINGRCVVEGRLYQW